MVGSREVSHGQALDWVTSSCFVNGMSPGPARPDETDIHCQSSSGLPASSAYISKATEDIFEALPAFPNLRVPERRSNVSLDDRSAGTPHLCTRVRGLYEEGQLKINRKDTSSGESEFGR